MEAKRIVILGGSGMLGRAIAVEGARVCGAGLEVHSGRRALDITDEHAVRAAESRWKGAVVINAAASTDVDGAESDPATADRVNRLGPRLLAQACARSGATLVHFSTDYIFDGRCTGPIPVDAPPGPLNNYGRSKLDGEREIGLCGCDHLIIRTSWLFAEHGRNFVRTILDLAARRATLSVVSDQRGRPTYAADLARVTFALLRAGARGTFHAANAGDCSWFEFASAIVAGAGLPCRVVPCTTSSHPRPARRPANSVLDIEHTIRKVGPIRHWREALSDCMSRLEPVAVAPSLRSA